jgi:glucose-6-phosphate isomerase
MMPYSAHLRKLADWYTQLLSESIGKQKNLASENVYAGLTPVPSQGATDQHSQLQLFQEGPFDKLVWFIEVEEYCHDYLIPPVISGGEKFRFLGGKSFHDLISAEFQGTRQSLTESGKANITTTIPQVNEQTLGALFMMFEITVGYLGELFEINTFDQPGVERSKMLTKEFLS